MGIAVKAGREFEERDERTTGVTPVIVNEMFAREFWPQGTDVVGKRIAAFDFKRWLQVVGVVADVHYDGVDRDVEAVVFRVREISGIRDQPGPSVLRGARVDGRCVADRGGAGGVGKAGPGPGDLRCAAIAGLDGSIGQRAAGVFVWLFTVFGAVALSLAITGIYSVVSYTVTQRRREIGIRVALGARATQVVGEVVRGTMWVAAVGVAIGLCGAWFATSAMTGLLAGVSAHDPWTYAAVVMMLGIAVLAATILPARRAASIDPATALREE